MKICSPQLGISPQSILGGEIYDRQILKYFSKMGVKSEIILPYKKPYERNLNWRITYLPFPFIYPPFLFNFLVLPELVNLYIKNKFDILRIHSPIFLGIAAVIFKKLFSDVPIVANYHWLGEGGWIDRYINPRVINYFDAIICDSVFTQKQIQKKYPLIKTRIYAVHNGVDETLHKMKQKPKYLLDKYKIDKSKTILLFMGLFIERKNPLFLLKLMQKLNQEQLPVHLILCGQGPLKNKIIETVIKNKIHNIVTIVPPVFNKDKNNLLNIADVFVHSSLNEGFSLSVIEAMAVGLPIVITDAYSSKEAVKDKVNGFLCKTEYDWIKNIKVLTKNKQLRNKISKNNINKVKKEFTWEIAAKKQLSIFRNLIKM